MGGGPFTAQPSRTSSQVVTANPSRVRLEDAFTPVTQVLQERIMVNLQPMAHHELKLYEMYEVGNSIIYTILNSVSEIKYLQYMSPISILNLSENGVLFLLKQLKLSLKTHSRIINCAQIYECPEC